MTASTFVAGQRATDLIAELDQILASGGWPVAGVPQAESLRTALSTYGDWLSGMRFWLNSPRPGAPKRPEALLVMALERMLAEPDGTRLPKAWKGWRKARSRRRGGRFYLFVELARQGRWFRLKAPSADSVASRCSNIAERQPKAA